MEFKICILTHTHLSRNPRVLKEALCLYDAGYEVTILNINFAKKLQAEDCVLLQNRSIKIETISDLSCKGWEATKDRVMKKLGSFLGTAFNIETVYALGYAPSRYLKRIPANIDLFICHQELPTYIGKKLIQKGLKVAFDFEDWYSEDILPNARRKRASGLLREVEKLALKTAESCWTTSNALSNALSLRYNCDKPKVIYNVFPSQNILNRQAIAPLKLLWFSQTVGPDRGLEPFIKALNQVQALLELHILGECNEDFKKILIGLCGCNYKLEFHSVQPNHLLADYITKFDIGLALELNEPLSRRYTVTNKLFQYIQAGLPVIASDTPGQKEILDKTTAGLLINLASPQLWINELEILLTDPVVYNRYKQKAVDAAKIYNWEIESIKLLSIVSEILGNNADKLINHSIRK